MEVNDFGITRNFIISGIDRAIISDESYIRDVVSELKSKSSDTGVILVICTKEIEVKGEKVSLDIVSPEMQKQGFRRILEINPFVTFWRKK